MKNSVLGHADARQGSAPSQFPAAVKTLAQRIADLEELAYRQAMIGEKAAASYYRRQAEALRPVTDEERALNEETVWRWLAEGRLI